jgi:hypothetical protein
MAGLPFPIGNADLREASSAWIHSLSKEDLIFQFKHLEIQGDSSETSWKLRKNVSSF